jgi:hypothetical protein
MKITTRISYEVDLFPDLNVDVSHDRTARIYGLDDVEVGVDELPALAKFFTEIAEDSIYGATQWHVHTDSDADASADADEEDPQLSFFFVFNDDESEDK